MTSPVDTTVKFFHSDMPGAPVLTGAAGKLISILDACLVNGFGATALTSLVVSGGVATAAFSGTFPGPVESVILVSGVTGAFTALNGEQKITAVGTGTVSFATAAANGTAAGTISIKMAPAGWEKRFTGTNLAVYRSLDAASTKFNLRVNDTGATVARVVGYETMTAISTGTNLFPTNAQLSGGGYWTKSYSANTAPIPWIVFSNGKRLWIGMAWGAEPGYSGGSSYITMALQGFGDFTSWKSTVDSYNCMIVSSPTPNDMSSSFGLCAVPLSPSICAARSHTGAAGAVALELAATFQGAQQEGSGFFSSWGELPGVTGQLMLTQPVLSQGLSALGPRGVMHELYHTPQGLTQAANIRRYDLVPGVGAAAGRKLMAVPCAAGPQDPTAGTYYPSAFVDTTGPWEE